MRNVDISGILLFYFILLDSPKKQTNKQTNKQKERWQGHRNSCGQLQWAWILKRKKIKTRTNKKKNTATNTVFNKTMCRFEKKRLDLKVYASNK